MRRQADDLDGWLSRRAPRLDASDPARLTRFARAWHAAWLARDPERADDGLAELLAPSFDGEALTLRPNPCGLAHFCVADWPVGNARLTVVWDDPQCPGNPYDDGLKGLSIWHGERRVYHQKNADPITLAL